ncbi:Rieske (2Fe-2S) protein [Phragmitibacter flavus]|uniref:Rieske (2Fe-2S) protein n=1 Tax=Phragmitibacter flavus TaxID=2576071 RepID=A0A5R8KGE4_9BACT|nr:Rieske (2Fe-2S) protein [Phragmitibacter flavus]TLD71372.1 Rieske (2Fe-2S) protein [Phragmitibacter flavus]
MNKRGFSKLLVVGGGLAVAGTVGVPALLTVLSPSLESDGGANWQPVGELDKFPLGEVAKALVPVPQEGWVRSLRQKGLFVLRELENEVVVYSRSCTDLSCPVTWDAGSEWFFCPCHGGVFSKEGEPKAGPPKDPLYRYATRVRSGVVEIDLNSVPPMI